MCVSECEGHQGIQGQEEERWSFWSEEAEGETQRGAGDRGNAAQAGDE